MRHQKDRKDDKEHQKVPPDSGLLEKKDATKQFSILFLKDVDLGY